MHFPRAWARREAWSVDRTSLGGCEAARTGRILMAKGNVRGRSETEPRVRRGYFECRYGQLHLYNAIPPGGGFDEGTALLCLHPCPRSGRMFHRFLTAMGRDRSIY